MNQILTNLKSVIFDIFGDMFFMFPDEYDEEEIQARSVEFPADWIKYRITISNNKEDYHLEFYFTPTQARLMAENFLGMEGDDISQLIIAETIKEAVNVMGGNLLNALHKDYHLGIPKECAGDDPAALKRRFNDDTHILISVEGEPFLAVFDQRMVAQQ